MLNNNDGDSDSSRSTYNGLSDYKKNNNNNKNDESNNNIPETFDFDNLNFTHIPAMSSDGM